MQNTMSSGVLTLINWHEQIHIWVSYVSSGVIGSWTVALKILKWSAARLPDFTAYPLGWLEPKAFAKKTRWQSCLVSMQSKSSRDPGSVPFSSQRSYPFPSYKVLCRGDCSCWRQSSSNSYAGFLDMACQIIIMWRVMCPCCFLWPILAESPTNMTRILTTHVWLLLYLQILYKFYHFYNYYFTILYSMFPT